MAFKGKVFSVTVIALLLASTLTAAINMQPIETGGPVSAGANGLTDPLTTQIEQKAGILSEAPPIEWNSTYGGTGDDHAQALVQTSDGGYALAGYKTASGSTDAWLVKTDAGGDLTWDKTFGGEDTEQIFSMVQTYDGGFAMAGTSNSYDPYGISDSYLIKTDSLGNLQWNKTYGGLDTHEAAWSMVQTSDGGFALAGYSYPGGGDKDIYFVKTDSNGEMQWNRTYLGVGDNNVWSVVQTDDGGYAMAGHSWIDSAGAMDIFLIKTDSAGNIQWNWWYGMTRHEAFALVQTDDGGYALAGYNYTATLGLNAYLVKTDTLGKVEWHKSYGEASDGSQAFSLVQTTDGGYALAGISQGDLYLVKTDSDGDMQWNITYGGTGDDYAQALVQTTDGGYALAGIANSFGAGSYDFWLVKIGKAEWGTIYIRADGSIDPPDAPISTVDGMTYTLTDNITSSADGIVIERSNMTLDGAGYTLQGSGSGYGFYLYGKNNVTIKHTNIKNFYCGIYLTYSSSYNSVSGNSITANNWTGILLAYSSSYNSISGNNITDNGEGIYLHSSLSNSISGNNITANNYAGIRLDYYSYYNSVSGNSIANGGYGIALFTSSSSSISGNTFTNDGLYVWGSYQNSVENNTVNGRPLVYLEGVSNYTVNDAGQVILVRCENIRTEGLNLSRTTVGIELLETGNSTISGNNITANNNYGIFLSSSSDSSISGNSITANNYGILLGDSSSSSISGNNITDNDYGIYPTSSSSNRVFHNNFINNTFQFNNYNSTNIWDDGYPSGGNYWSDYTDVDLNNDGIWDHPYIIDANNQDNYPLVNPWIAFEGQTIYIRADGSIDPPTAPIQRNGDFYTLTDNIIVDADGILIERSNITVDGDGYSLQGSGSDRSVVGFDLSGIDGVTIKRTNIKDFWWGVRLYYSSYNSISGNNITQNTHYGGGIGLAFSSYNGISGNGITEEYFGIYSCHSCNNNSISGNNIIANNGYVGIYLDYSSNNDSISGNIIANNEHGIRLYHSSNNCIYHNDFINNTMQVSFVDSSNLANIWDDGYPSGGNYWSDYSGVDVKRGPGQDLPGSDGIGDTPYVIDSDNQDRYPVVHRDVAVLNVVSSKTVVGQNYSMNVSVTVENQGDYTETFNVTAYANTTIIGSENVTLPAGNSTTVTFTWDTTGWPEYSNYTISAVADIVPDETDTGDNTFIDGTITIAHVGDITGDGKVDTQDLARVSAAYGSLRVNDPNDPRYGQYWHPATCSTCPHTPNADITNDGKVDIQDLARTSGNFGWHQ